MTAAFPQRTAFTPRVVLTLDIAEARALRLMVDTCPVRMPPEIRTRLLATLDDALAEIGDAA
jgi:hypothetical protein